MHLYLPLLKPLMCPNHVLLVCIVHSFCRFWNWS